MDQNIVKKNDQYFVTLTQKSSTNSREIGLLSKPLYEILEKQSAIKSIMPIRSLGDFYLESKDQKIKRQLTLARQNLFDYFDLDFIQGQPSTALNEPNSIVLSKSTAMDLFSGENPIGKNIRLIGEDEFLFTVTGVISDDVHSHMKFDNFISWESKSVSGKKFSEWYKYSIYLYVTSDTKKDQLEDQLSKSLSEEMPDSNLRLNLYPSKNVYFDTADVEFMIGFNHGNKQNLIILSIVGLLILIIGTVNYININISLILKRVREIGVRKVLGATKGNLRMQFFSDAFIMIILSGATAFTLADLLVYTNADFFNSQHINLPTSEQYVMAIVLMLLAILVIVTGYYPALFSRNIPLPQTLKSQINSTGQKSQLSNTLLGIQFALTFGLILMTAIIYRQYSFLRSKDSGYQKEDIITIHIGESKTIPSKKEQALYDFRNVPGVLSGTMSTDILGRQSTNSSYYASTPDMQNVEEEGALSYYFGVDSGFINTYNIELVAGRNFDVTFASDSMAVLVNETLVEKLNLGDPIGKEIRLFGNNGNSKKSNYTIIGVMKDFNFQSLHKKVSPTAFYLTSTNFWNITLRYKTSDVLAFNKKLKEIWSQYDTEIPYQYSFLDQQLENFYQKEKSFNELISKFTLVSLLLSVLGLFGVTSYSIQQKRKEISIRKILGASVSELMLLFNRRYLIIFTVSVVLAIPFAAWATTLWLSGFAYRIENNATYYIISATLLVTIIILTVSISSFKFATGQPAKYLRDD